MENYCTGCFIYFFFSTSEKLQVVLRVTTWFCSSCASMRYCTSWSYSLFFNVASCTCSRLGTSWYPSNGGQEQACVWECSFQSSGLGNETSFQRFGHLLGNNLVEPLNEELRGSFFAFLSQKKKKVLTGTPVSELL